MQSIGERIRWVGVERNTRVCEQREERSIQSVDWNWTGMRISVALKKGRDDVSHDDVNVSVCKSWDRARNEHDSLSHQNFSPQERIHPSPPLLRTKTRDLDPNPPGYDLFPRVMMDTTNTLWYFLDFFSFIQAWREAEEKWKGKTDPRKGASSSFQSVHSHRTFSITRMVMAREERKKCLSFVITITLFTNPLEEANLLPLQTFSVSWTSNLYSVMKRGEREHSEKERRRKGKNFSPGSRSRKKMSQTARSEGKNTLLAPYFSHLQKKLHFMNWIHVRYFFFLSSLFSLLLSLFK